MSVRSQFVGGIALILALHGSGSRALAQDAGVEVDAGPDAQAPQPETGAEFGASARIRRPAGPGEFELGGTGSKVNAPLREIPATVNVIDQQQLRERGVVDLQQALELLPGVMPMWTYGAFQYVQMRGFQALNLYDGRRDMRMIVAGSAPNAGLLDIDRIEVLRGPSSVLYGYGAVGGVINQIRKRASRTPLYEIAGGLGTPYQWLATAAAQGPVGTKLAYRVDLGHVTHRDFRRAETSRNQVTATVRYTPTAKDQLNVRFSAAFDQYTTDVGLPSIEDPANPGRWVLPYGTRYGARYSSQQDHFDYSRMEGAVDYRHDFSQQIYLDVRAWIVKDHYNYLAAESLSYVPPTGMQRAQVAREYLYFARGWRPIQSSAELHAEVETGPVRHALLAGYQLESFTGKSDRSDLDGATLANVDFQFPVDDSPAVSYDRTAIDHYRIATHSLYAFDHMHLLDQLVLTGGVRLDFLRSRTRREFLDRDTQDAVPDAKTGMFRSPNLTQDFATTGSAGLVYMPWDFFSAYASYANAFTPHLVSPSARAVTSYAPEHSHQFEGGLRLRVERARQLFELDAAGYLIRKNNLLVPRGTDDFVTAGLAQSRGLDMRAQYAVSFVQLSGSYSFIDAHYLKFAGPDPVTGDNVSFHGKALQWAPRHSGNAWARFVLAERVSLGVGTRVKGRTWADDANRLQLPSYALLDASVSVGSEHASFTLRANNLLGRVSYFSSVINEGSANPQLTPGPGREILGTLRMTL
jgi:TonB-dependent siderophore receptor